MLLMVMFLLWLVDKNLPITIMWLIEKEKQL